MLADFLAYIWPALPAFFLAGCCFVLAGGIWLVAIRRHEVTMGPDPVLLPVVHTEWSIEPVQPVEPNYRRPDSDTGVVARIPGATRPVDCEPEYSTAALQPTAAGPVCSACGGPFGNCSCYSQKSSSEETVVLPAVPSLPPQFVALSRFFTQVDEARADTDEAMGRLVDDLAGRDDCPLTTVEIQIEPVDPPEYRAATARLGDTRELSSVMKKVSAP